MSALAIMYNPMLEMGNETNKKGQSTSQKGRIGIGLRGGLTR